MNEQPRKILRLSAVRTATGLGRSTIYERERSGNFPKRVELGSRSVGWYSDEVAEWIEDRARKVEVAR